MIQKFCGHGDIENSKQNFPGLERNFQVWEIKGCKIVSQDVKRFDVSEKPFLI